MSIITRPQNADYDAGYARTFTSKTVDPVCRGCGQKRWLVSYDHSYRTLTCKRCKMVCVEVKSARPGVYEFKDQYPLEIVPLPIGGKEKLLGGDALALACGGMLTSLAARSYGMGPREDVAGEVKTLRFTRLPPGPEPKPGPTVQVLCKVCAEPEDHCRCCPICLEYPCSCSLLALQERP
jgi:hypothetical protein